MASCMGKWPAASRPSTPGFNVGTGRSVPPECDARKPSARFNAGVLERQVRRAALGLCRSEMDVVCMLPLSRETCGVAQSARGPKIAGWCPHPTGSRLRFSSPGHGRLKTVSGFIRHGPVLALTIRGRPGDSACTPRPPRIRKAARHRPVSTLTLTAGRRGPAQRARISPVAGLARSSPKGVTTLPAEPAGAPPPPSSRRTLRQAPGGLPPA